MYYYIAPEHFAAWAKLQTSLRGATDAYMMLSERTDEVVLMF